MGEFIMSLLKYDYDNSYVPKVIDLKNKYLTQEEIDPTGKEFRRSDLENFIEPKFNTSKIFTIYFDKITGLKEFNNDDHLLDDLFDFDVSIRAYSSSMNQIMIDLNYIFNEYPEFAYKFIAIKQEILLNEKLSVQEISDLIKSVVMDEHYRDIVKSIDESTYTLEDDDESFTRKKSDIQDLQITKETNKLIIETAFSLRVSIPLMYGYLMRHPRDNSEMNEIFYKLFEDIIIEYSRSTDTEILNKLYKIISSRVKATTYTDKVIWNYLRNLSIDASSLTDEIEKSIIRQSIHKIVMNKQVISFLSVVIKYKISFSFHVKYPLSYKPFQTSGDDDSDDIDENDKMSLTLQYKLNDITSRSNELTIDSFIREKITEGVVTKDEFLKVAEHLTVINDFQKSMLKMYYSDKFKIIDYRDKKVIILLIIMYKELLPLYKLIPQLLLSVRDNDSNRRGINRMTKPVRNSQKFKELNTEFDWIADRIKVKNPIIEMGVISGYDFKFYDGTKIIIDKNLLIEEISNLMLSLC